MTSRYIRTRLDYVEFNELRKILEEIFADHPVSFYGEMLDWISVMINSLSKDEIIYELISCSPRTLEFIEQPTERMVRLNELRWKI